ncbi:MAG: hypothetical protein ABSF85_19340 [Terriglobales bacterium]
MQVHPVKEFCDRAASSFTFRAIVYTSPSCKGFIGYGDADPSNVSSLVRGAEMRVAETRAVNRALRKAYGIGICSVEEIGTIPNPVEKLPPQNANGNGNGAGPKVRDRLASREQVQNFVQQLADWAEKDRNALLCQLNSYSQPKQESA